MESVDVPVDLIITSKVSRCAGLICMCTVELVVTGEVSNCTG